MPTPTIEAPARSIQQRMEALQLANATRTRRAEFKRDLKARGGRNEFGRPVTTPIAGVVPLLQDPPDWLQTMKIFDLLIALPKVGRVKANKILNRTRMSPSKTVGGMSDRQRRELSQLLGRWSW